MGEIVVNNLALFSFSRVFLANWSEGDREDDGGVCERKSDVWRTARPLGGDTKVQSSLGLSLPRLAEDGRQSTETVQRPW